MCAEKDPINCHRAILCGKELKANGFGVMHIVPVSDGAGGESHSRLENRLVKLYFKNSERDLIDDGASKLEISYKQHNAKIGYRPAK
jgi:hypothetical protein